MKIAKYAFKYEQKKKKKKVQHCPINRAIYNLRL